MEKLKYVLVNHDKNNREQNRLSGCSLGSDRVESMEFIDKKRHFHPVKCDIIDIMYNILRHRHLLFERWVACSSPT